MFLRELPRSWWEASGGSSGWTLIAFFFSPQLDFRQISEQSARAGEEAGMLQPGLDLSGCCRAAPLAIGSSFLKASCKTQRMWGSPKLLLSTSPAPLLLGWIALTLETLWGGKELSPQREVASFASTSVAQEYLALIWWQMKLELVKPWPYGLQGWKNWLD